MLILILRLFPETYLAPPHDRSWTLTMNTTTVSSYTMDWAPSSTMPRIPVSRETADTMLLDRAPILPPAIAIYPHTDRSGSSRSHRPTTQCTAWACWGWPGGRRNPSPVGTRETTLQVGHRHICNTSSHQAGAQPEIKSTLKLENKRQPLPSQVAWYNFFQRM